MNNWWIAFGLILAAHVIGGSLQNSACLLSGGVVDRGYFQDSCAKEPAP